MALMASSSLAYADTDYVAETLNGGGISEGIREAVQGCGEGWDLDHKTIVQSGVACAAGGMLGMTGAGATALAEIGDNPDLSVGMDGFNAAVTAVGCAVSMGAGCLIGGVLVAASTANDLLADGGYFQDKGDEALNKAIEDNPISDKAAEAQAALYRCTSQNDPDLDCSALEQANNLAQAAYQNLVASSNSSKYDPNNPYDVATYGKDMPDNIGNTNDGTAALTDGNDGGTMIDPNGAADDGYSALSDNGDQKKKDCDNNNQNDSECQKNQQASTDGTAIMTLTGAIASNAGKMSQSDEKALGVAGDDNAGAIGKADEAALGL